MSLSYIIGFKFKDFIPENLNLLIELELNKKN